ncbi:glycoside hydrolase family 130 protein [Spirochaetia bacterium 38H-sp]|uniref:Glycoside hydrolase family 130 protein n=1 Tax=Rarispira pelagica TaxID=3141764 RepID=A0ABU9UCD9_9SPIR
MERYGNNPIIKPSYVKPSNPDYEVVGAFNPGAVFTGEEYILLLRVAERVKQEPGYIKVPCVEFSGDGIGYPSVLAFKEDDPDVRKKDTRGVVYKGIDYLSSMSHIRIARSKDGKNFIVDDEPFIFPSTESERFGVEDARCVFLDGAYYINYTSVSPDGWCTSLARTSDFKSVERLGTIFHPQNKDVCIFPEKIGGLYHALHRPNNDGFGKPSIWYASSPDLLHWGQHLCIARPRDMREEALKIGGGAPCIKTDDGWLQIYHAKGEGQRYTLFAMLLDYEEPWRVIRRGIVPVMEPRESYEIDGFFGNVLFTNGIVAHPDGTLYIYYGAADEFSCLAFSSVFELLEHLNRYGE